MNEDDNYWAHHLRRIHAKYLGKVVRLQQVLMELDDKKADIKYLQHQLVKQNRELIEKAQEIANLKATLGQSHSLDCPEPFSRKKMKEPDQR